MIQCKICGSPLGKEPTTEELEKHWKKHHSWHWESNNEKTPEEALLKNKKFKDQIHLNKKNNSIIPSAKR